MSKKIRTADDLFPDDGTLQSGSVTSSRFEEMMQKEKDDKLSLSSRELRNSIESNETLLLETDDSWEPYNPDDGSLLSGSLPSYANSQIFEEAFEINEMEHIDPVYNDFDYDFSLIDLDNNVLNNIMKYSLNKQGDDNNNDEKIEVSNNNDLEFKIEKALTWSEIINYYWIGLFNNLKHKRKYVEYCNQVLNFKKKIHIISQKISIDNITKPLEEEEKEKRNYFNIENYDVNSYDSNNLFSTSESYKLLIEIEELFNMIDNLLIDDIIFMKNAKAPIGDFLNRYHLIKNDCLKLSNIKNNKIFNNARCSTEIKQYKNSKSIRKIKEKFYKDMPNEAVKEFEEKFKDDLMKDKEYMEKDIFLFSLKDWMKSLIFKQKEEQNYEELINYCNRQKIYFMFISVIYSIYRDFNLLDNNSSTKSLETYTLIMLSGLIKEIELIRYMSTDEKKRESQRIIKIFKHSFINKDEYAMHECDNLMAQEIIVNDCFWNYQNKKLIKDIFKLLEFLNQLDEKKGGLKIINEFAKQIHERLNKLLEEENNFENMISNWYQNSDEDKKALYRSNIFSEKELWWYYFVYNSNVYYHDNEIDYKRCCYPNTENNDNGIDCKRCCYPNTENNDIEKGSLIYNEEKTDAIKIFLETNSYLHHVVNKERPKYPLYKDFKWDKLDFNKDKIEFSKRQLRYNKYFIEKLNNELINNELKQIGELNESLVRKNFILECIENTEEVLNELENMGNFIKEGVLLNEQLFFKLVLFGINILIFIGQYFWNNHIEPTL